MSLNVKTLKGNIQRMFDKSLSDLIRGIRSNKDNETRYITQCMDEIRQELKQDSRAVKANAVAKLFYLQMFGFDISWASFNIVEVMASTRFTEKRIAYMCAAQCFHDQTDVLMLTTNLIRKDINATQMYDAGVSMSGLACFVSPDLARDLANDVVTLLNASRPYVRKKAVLLLYKIFLKYPDALRPTFPRLKEKLDDPDPGVQSAAVNVICELARKNPKNYLSLAPTFFKLMTSSTNNWMLIKIIKLFGALVPLEPRLGRKLLEPLTNLINSTSAMSLLYECINTVIAVLISISNSGPGDYSASIQLCVQKLGVLIEDADQNLKYLGLLAMGRILQTHPKAVQAHKDIVLGCLDDKDESIRLRALDLLYGMVGKRNIMEIVKKLMFHVDAAEGANYRDELLSRIIGICAHNNYVYITNFEWYVSVLVELTKVDGTSHGSLIAAQMLDVAVRVQSIRHLAVQQMALLIQNAHLLLRGSQQHRSNISEVLTAAAFICGEYAEHLDDAHATLEAMLRTKPSSMPGHIQATYVQNMGKLYAKLIDEAEKADDWDSVASLDNMLLSKLPMFEQTEHLEAQERACTLRQMIVHCERLHESKELLGDCLLALYDGELNPVAPKAQRKVPIPAGLDLDAWINDPPRSPSESDEEEEDNGFRLSSLHSTPSHRSDIASNWLPEERPSFGGEITKPAPSEEQLESMRAARKLELEHNPYYLPSKSNSKRASDESDEEESKKRRKKKHRRSPAKENVADLIEVTDIKSIPGVAGLAQFESQKGQTMKWSDVDSKKKKKKSRRGRNRRSSSGDEAAIVVEHEVNRDDGDLPDGAVTTDDEENPLAHDDDGSPIRLGGNPKNLNKALDMDLDEPLRADETLYVRKHRPDAMPVKKEVKRENGGEYILKKEKREKRKKEKKSKRCKREEDTTVVPDEESTEVPDKKEEEPSVDDLDFWLSVSNAKDDKKEVKKEEDVKKRIKSTSSQGKKSKKHRKTKENVAENISQTTDPHDKSEYEPTASGGSPTIEVDPPLTSVYPLAANKHLSMTYSTHTSAMSRDVVTVTLRITNEGEEECTIKNMQWSTVDCMTCKLQQANMALDGVPIQFNLAASESNQVELSYVLNAANMPAKMRGTMIYMLQTADGTLSEKIDFSLKLPCAAFCVADVISSESYASVLSTGELTCNESMTLSEGETSSLHRIVDRLSTHAHLTIVEQLENSATMYAQLNDGLIVCLLLKVTQPRCTLEIRTNDATLATNMAKELREIVTGKWDYLK